MWCAAANAWSRTRSTASGSRIQTNRPPSGRLSWRQAILTGQLQQASPSIARQGRTRGILIARGGVDERRPFADPVLALENVGHRVHAHAMPIEWHADELQPELLEHADRAAVLEFFENDAVARARESLGAERQSLHRAVGDDHVFERWTQAVIALESFGGD